LRIILRDAAEPARSELAEIATRIRAMTADDDEADSTELIRRDRDTNWGRNL